jgi:hypothetical protein
MAVHQLSAGGLVSVITQGVEAPGAHNGQTQPTNHCPVAPAVMKSTQSQADLCIHTNISVWDHGTGAVSGGGCWL